MSRRFASFMTLAVLATGALFVSDNPVLARGGHGGGHGGASHGGFSGSSRGGFRGDFRGGSFRGDFFGGGFVPGFYGDGFDPGLGLYGHGYGPSYPYGWFDRSFRRGDWRRRF